MSAFPRWAEQWKGSHHAQGTAWTQGSCGTQNCSPCPPSLLLLLCCSCHAVLQSESAGKEHQVARSCKLCRRRESFQEFPVGCVISASHKSVRWQWSRGKWAGCRRSQLLSLGLHCASFGDIDNYWEKKLHCRDKDEERFFFTVIFFAEIVLRPFPALCYFCGTSDLIALCPTGYSAKRHIFLS